MKCLAYLLDTDICIYIIKKEPPTVLKRFKALSPGEIGISSVTVAELYYGAAKSKHLEKNTLALQGFLLPLEVCDFDEIAALCYGEIRATLEAKDKQIGPLDLMIAAQAKSLNIPLVTNNTKEFSRVPGLKVENWVGT